MVQQIEEQWIRDLLYLCAVGKYKLRQFLAAREQLVEILKVSPESRQAQALKTAVDDKIVQEVRCLSGHMSVPAVILATVLLMAICTSWGHRYMNIHGHENCALPVQGLVGVGIGAAVMGGLALVVGGIVASRR